MSQLQSDKHVFADNSGAPLENGSIYVGQPSTDPRQIANRKTVTFHDSSGASFTAAQPLRTIGGKICYNGRPIAASVDGAHSMLILNSAGVQVDYAASITPDSGGSPVTLGDTIRVGLVLDDVKLFDVSVGDVVRNVGKLTATDALGADWLVISSTGGPGDDIDLIDFDNGLQGLREESKIYRSEGIGTHVLPAAGVVLSTSDATAMRNTWTTIDLSDHVPETASSAIIKITARANYASASIADSLTIQCSARRYGSSASPGPANYVLWSTEQTNTNDTIQIDCVNEFTIPLNSGETPQFDLYLLVNDPSSGSNNTTPDLFVYVVGYTVNP